MSGTGQPAITHAEYRPDIDGLRAIAVLSVVGFHAFPASIKGGFVGVDIFFVISGFLISSIILKGLSRERFSYVEFYVRRIKRIFPALVLILTACLAFGWFFLYSQEYQLLGKHTAGGVGFIDNILLWQESGYFDKSHGLKPLLHLWSLGIEEQYYLVWPLALGLLWRTTHKLLPLILAVFATSFVLNVILVNIQPTATFYLPHTRFWELMIGSILAYIANVRPQAIAPHSLISSQRRALYETVSVAGLVLIVTSLLVTTEEKPFPGALAALPTFGAACLIAAGPDAFVNRRLLALRPMVFVGLISYPLYIWHWPLLSFTYIIGGITTGEMRAAAVLVAFALAWATYVLVEKPIRSSPTRRPAAILLVAAIVLGVTGIGIYLNGGLDFRAINTRKSAEFNLLSTSSALNTQIRQAHKAHRCDGSQLSPDVLQYCSIYGSGTDSIVVWGDSHSEAWVPVFNSIADDLKLRVILLAHGGCPPVLSTRRTDHEGAIANCTEFGTGEAMLQAIRVFQPRHIFVIGRWSLYTEAPMIETTDPSSTATLATRNAAFGMQLTRTLKELAAIAPTTVFRTMPELHNDVTSGLLRGRKVEPTEEEHMRRESTANSLLEQARGEVPQLDIFDPGSLSCQATCRIQIDGTLLYSDDNHISAQGSLLFKSLIMRDHLSGIRIPGQ